MPPQDEQQRWFAEQVKPHEPMLRAWLTRRFPSEGDIDDFIQEAYLRILQAQLVRPISSPKAYLFATARNVALERIRHRKVAGEFPLAEIEASPVLDEEPLIPDAVGHSEELALLTQAIQSLPTRCRQILTLRKIYGLSQREVAKRLGIAEHTVESQGTIGLHKIADFFRRTANRPPFRHE